MNFPPRYEKTKFAPTGTGWSPGLSQKRPVVYVERWGCSKDVQTIEFIICYIIYVNDTFLYHYFIAVLAVDLYGASLMFHTSNLLKEVQAIVLCLKLLFRHQPKVTSAGNPEIPINQKSAGKS